jgi:tRNA (adenine22-N1)-methyltransferase
MNGASDFSLDNRLALCADFVRDGAKVADIGTDHAYLPVWLCRIGRCDTAIAADINPLPLERGIETAVLTIELKQGFQTVLKKFQAMRLTT